MEVNSGESTERAALAWLIRVMVVVAFVAAGVDLVGWATGVEELTRILPSSLAMRPWTALLLLVLGVGLVMQWGQSSPVRTQLGRGLAAAVGLCAVLFLADSATGGSFGLGDFWLSHPTRAETADSLSPGPSAALSILLLAIAVGLVGIDRRWTRRVWPLCLAAAVFIPLATAFARISSVVPFVDQATLSVLSLLLLLAAVVKSGPERFPLAWLLAGPRRWTALRLVAFLAVLPLTTGLLRWGLREIGLSAEAERVVSIVVGVSLFAAIAFLFERRNQYLQSENELLDGLLAQAESRYRQIAENSVDIIAHLRGTEVVWISPSVEAPFGWTVEQWVGTDFTRRIVFADLDPVVSGLRQVESGQEVGARSRVLTADGGYHWVEARGKPYVDAKGAVDGLIVSVRIVDDQVDAELKLAAHRQRFEAVVAHSPSAISVCDLQFRFTLVNESFCRMFRQTSVADVLGRTKEEILPTELLAGSRGAMDRILAGDPYCENEFFNTGTEEMVVLTQQFPLLDSTGAVSELVTVRTDITDR
ncbi:MAG: PAS domain-containing protein, partial [Mycobacterium sp.]|nr:PAS domain-containing protein [Mycobacterium sp.]